MALKVPWKSLSRRGAFSSKQVAFFALVALVLVVGVSLRGVHYFAQPASEEKAPVAVETTPPEAAIPPATDAAGAVPKTPPAPQEAASKANGPAEPVGNAAEPAKPETEPVEQAVESKLPGSDVILVSRKPVEVLASPSASAPAMYGFPAGRPFRVIGREGGFAHIQDIRSGARGWIDEAALTAPPPRAAVAAPSKSAPGAVSRKSVTASKPKPTKNDAQVATESEESDSAQPRNRPGLFGGLFGGIFRGGN